MSQILRKRMQCYGRYVAKGEDVREGRGTFQRGCQDAAAPQAQFERYMLTAGGLINSPRTPTVPPGITALCLSSSKSCGHISCRQVRITVRPQKATMEPVSLTQYLLCPPWFLGKPPHIQVSRRRLDICLASDLLSVEYDFR